MCAANTVRFVQLSQLCIESIMRDRCALEVVAASQARELVEARQRVQAAGMMPMTCAAAVIALMPHSCSVCGTLILSSRACVPGRLVFGGGVGGVVVADRLVWPSLTLLLWLVIVRAFGGDGQGRCQDCEARDG